MYSSCETPDGYTINQAGQWTVNGVVQYIAGKGIQTKQSGEWFQLRELREITVVGEVNQIPKVPRLTA